MDKKIAESALTKFYPEYAQSQAVDADIIKSIVESLCIHQTQQQKLFNSSYLVTKSGWTINNIFHGLVREQVRLQFLCLINHRQYTVNFGIKHGDYCEWTENLEIKISSIPRHCTFTNGQ